MRFPVAVLAAASFLVLGACPRLCVATVVRVPSESATIQAAVDASEPGDTVLVAAGVYSGTGNVGIDFNGVNIKLLSESGADLTIIDCGGQGGWLSLHSGEDTTAVIGGFTIMNGYALSGAGISCVGAAPVIRDCVFRENNDPFGGILYLHDSDGAMVSGCAFRDNIGRPVYCGSSSRVVFDACTFAGNDATSTYEGGGLKLSGCPDVLIKDCSFEGNEGAQRGGGICSIHSFPLLEGCVFSGNSATHSGGAFYAENGSVEFVDCSFHDNVAAGQGGAVTLDWAIEGASSFLRCTFVGNTAGSGGAVDLVYSHVSFESCSFVGNSGIKGGAALLASSHGSPVISLDSCVFAHNSAEHGGALCERQHGSRLLTNCTFVENDAVEGSDLFCDEFGEADVDMQRCILAFNQAAEVLVCNDSSLWVTQCVVFANSGGDSLCGVHEDNAFVDPLFCGISQDDWTLCADSWCLPEISPWLCLVGAEVQGCGVCGSYVVNSSWGAIKSLFR